MSTAAFSIRLCVLQRRRCSRWCLREMFWRAMPITTTLSNVWTCEREVDRWCRSTENSSLRGGTFWRTRERQYYARPGDIENILRNLSRRGIYRSIKSCGFNNTGWGLFTGAKLVPLAESSRTMMYKSLRFRGELRHCLHVLNFYKVT